MIIKKDSFKALFVIFLIFLMIFFEIKIQKNYLDEILALFSISYLYIIRKKIDKKDKIEIFLLCLVILIGIFSNIYSKINLSLISIGIDVLSETKVIFVFFAARYFSNLEIEKKIINWLTPFSKIYFTMAFICGIVTQFKNIGMTEDIRYNINSFRFIFPMTFQFYCVSILFFLILISNKRIKYKNFFLCIALISLVLTTKSSALIFIVLYTIFNIYFIKKENISFKIIIFMLFIVAIIGQFQIKTYLLNKDAPRYLFFYYSIITANKYFPFGAGFGTFGSAEAAKNYSKLYIDYGFSLLHGMGKYDGKFLCDTFWPMGIGQFGWIGFFIYVYIYLKIFSKLINIKRKILKEKSCICAAYLQFLIHAIGAAILSSSSGVLVFMIIGIFSSYNKELEGKNGKKI